MADDREDEPRDVDRDAILARRRAMMARALEGLRTTSRIGAVAAVASTGLIGCPAQACLSIAIDDNSDDRDDCEGDSGTDTGATETDGTDTADTDTGC